MKKNKILFLCTGNSCRSQMAEGFAKKLLSKNLYIESAGTEAHGLNPYTVKTMNEIGIDISHHKSTKININDISKFDLIITLCGDAKDKCPIVDKKKHIHWDIPDPANFIGNETDTKQKYSEVREMILEKIKKLNI
ncbi:arsenate reductase ArsC [bacterium]|nr:arsenate reductase ArsC [bacterium]